jgi:hypothetical protein
VEHGDHIAKTANKIIRTSSGWREKVNNGSLLDFDVTKGQRNQQDLDFLRLGGQSKQQSEDVIDTLVIVSF